jgi:hypothetical protein
METSLKVPIAFLMSTEDCWIHLIFMVRSQSSPEPVRVSISAVSVKPGVVNASFADRSRP